MPFKHNAARRHRIGKMKYKVTNGLEYEAGLRGRGSLTLWVMTEAQSFWQAPKRMDAGWPATLFRSGDPDCSDSGRVFGRRSSQTEGLLASLLKLMRLDLAVPDRMTLSRRARTWRSDDSCKGRTLRRHRLSIRLSTELRG